MVHSYVIEKRITLTLTESTILKPRHNNTIQCPFNVNDIREDSGTCESYVHALVMALKKNLRNNT